MANTGAHAQQCMHDDTPLHWLPQPIVCDILFDTCCGTTTQQELMHSQWHALKSECGCAAAMVCNETLALLCETLMQHAQIINAGPAARLDVLILWLVARCGRMAFLVTRAILIRNDLRPQGLYRYHANTHRACYNDTYASMMPRAPYVSDDHTEPPLSQAPCATTQNYDKTADIF
jgi:hypothetical protein